MEKKFLYYTQGVEYDGVKEGEVSAERVEKYDQLIEIHFIVFYAKFYWGNSGYF